MVKEKAPDTHVVLPLAPPLIVTVAPDSQLPEAVTEFPLDRVGKFTVGAAGGTLSRIHEMLTEFEACSDNEVWFTVKL
jgi:hypothetical protein